MDLEAFECPICLSVFQGSIFQCKNGHVVCEACSVHIHGTCPSCREPVGDIRCRALENAIAGMALPCSFRHHGCTQLLKHTEKRDHEAFLCQHAPLACPFKGCAYAHTVDYVPSFAGSAWLVCMRRSMPFQVLLDPANRRVFMLLNGRDVRSGGSLSLFCLGPPPAANQLLKYKLKVDGNGKPDSLSLSLSASGSVPYRRSWTGQRPTDGFLFVPGAYCSYLNCVLVNVRVKWSSTVDKCPN